MIEIGDYVDIHFENVENEFNLEVLHTPCASGDSWKFRKLNNGDIIYVNNYSKMVKIET